MLVEILVWCLVKVVRHIIWISGKTTWRGPFKEICDWKVMGVMYDIEITSHARVDVKFNTDDFHMI